jgi:hypothetical protein
MRQKVKDLIALGMFDQNTLFATLYPTWRGHYSTLRNIISEVKNNG